MTTGNPSYRPPRQWLRSLAALTLLALQGGIALLPLAEPRHDRGSYSHVEQKGSRHLYAHDEATCAVCSVRSLHASVPGRSCELLAARQRTVVAALDPCATPSRDDAPTNFSRAPPLIG